MDALESNVSNLLRKITDIKRICGSESYDNANTVYGIYKSGSVTGISGAKESYEKLKQRYEKNNAGGFRPAATNP